MKERVPCPICQHPIPPNRRCYKCWFGKNPHLVMTESELLRARDDIERVWRDQVGGLKHKSYDPHRKHIRKPLSRETRQRVNLKFNEYLDAARRNGKDVSTQAKQRPYLMNARRWALATPEQIREKRRKERSTIRRRVNYYRTISAMQLDKLKGVNRGGGSI